MLSNELDMALGHNHKMKLLNITLNKIGQNNKRSMIKDLFKATF